jgi:hypothetical protein
MRYLGETYLNRARLTVSIEHLWVLWRESVGGWASQGQGHMRSFRQLNRYVNYENYIARNISWVLGFRG